MNSKTKRRLTILLSAAVLVGGAGGSFVIYRKHRTALLYETWRSEGLAAYKAGDYNVALDKLGHYVNRFQTDSDALYACAESRLHIEEQNHQEIPPAIGLFRRFLDLNPDRADVREQLLDLYLKVGFFTETLNTADQILKTAPKSPKALRARAYALFGLRRYDESLRASSAYNEIAPDDFEAQRITLAVMQRRGATEVDLIQHVDKLLEKYPNDSRFELLKSVTYAMTGDRQSAVAWARKSADHPAADPEFLKMLVRHLDALGLFTEATGLQEKAVKQNPDAETRFAWISRLLESERYADVVTLLENDTKDADVNLVVCHIIALSHLNRTADAELILANLANRGKTDPHAAVAAAALDKALLHPDQPKIAIAACNDALTSDGQNPFFLFLLGEAYDRSGESELAIDRLEEAAQITPVWAEPLVAKSKILMQQGNLAEAFIAAQSARGRAPNDRDAMVAVATTATYVIPKGNTADFKSLLTLVQEIEHKFPDEQRVLPVHVMLLAHLGQTTEATKLLLSGLAPSFPATQEMLLALANASHAVNLGQEDACFNRCEQAHGMSAQLAYAKACWFFINKHSDEGLRYFSDMQSQHANGDIEWKTDWARYLDLVNDPRAKDEWISLGDNHSDNVKIQWLALGARTAQVDRPFISRTIERLRTLRGDKGTFLSIIRAKYILQGDPSEKDAAEAVLLLTDVNRQNPRLPFAHILLANAYQRQKNINGAIDELSLAADLVPDSSQVALDVARLLNHQRDFTRARPYIDRVARGNTATSDERRAAGTLLAEAADIPAAIQQFEQIPAAQLTTSDKLSLASFYRYQNIPAKVEPLLEELLKTPTADSVQLAAEYYTSQNRPKDAEHALLLLDTVNCPVTVKSRIRAAYFARNSTPEKTIQEFLTATKTSPTDPAAWNQLLAFCLYLGRMDDVARFAPDAHAAIPSDPALTILSANLPLIRDLGSDAAIRPLFIAIIQAPANAADIVEALQLVASTRSHKITSDQMLVQLRQIAGRCPSVLALQMLAARVCLANGRADDAVDIASHALQAFPGAPDAAQITAESLAAAGRWNEVVTIGKQWRDRILASPLPADIVIANAYMQLGNMDAGLQQLQPHLNRALKAPEENPNIILLYVQGLVNSNKTEQASQLLQPLLTLPSWRREYVFVAARLPNEKDSAAWLARVSGAIPPEASDEKLQLAMGYQELASRTQNVEYRKTAVAIIEPIAARPDCNPQTLAVLGSFYESQGNLAGAEQIYRRSLQGKPDQPIILNNLAMVIVHKNGDPNEAFEYVSRAISLSPTVPNFFDTQATILAAQKSYDKAIVSIGEAIKLAPKDPQWQAARIWLLSLSGQQKTAASEYQQLQSTQNLAKLPEEARQRLNTVGFQ